MATKRTGKPKCFTISMPGPMYRIIKALAEAESRSVSAMIKVMVEKELEVRKKEVLALKLPVEEVE